jgi:hypothetical protein
MWTRIQIALELLVLLPADSTLVVFLKKLKNF